VSFQPGFGRVKGLRAKAVLKVEEQLRAALLLADRGAVVNVVVVVWDALLGLRGSLESLQGLLASSTHPIAYFFV
jgi:hypothetical protein